MAKLLRKAYDSYNQKYFGGELPKIDIQWSSRLSGDRINTFENFRPTKEPQYAEFTWYLPYQKNSVDGIILLASWMKSHWGVWRMTLLHEMVHVKLRDKEQKCPTHIHTKVWKEEMRRLAVAGAFDNLWSLAFAFTSLPTILWYLFTSLSTS